MVQAMGDLFVLGGEYAHKVSIGQKSIYQLRCSSEECTWKTLNQELRVPRIEFVAIVVMDSIVNCSKNKTGANVYH